MEQESCRISKGFQEKESNKQERDSLNTESEKDVLDLSSKISNKEDQSSCNFRCISNCACFFGCFHFISHCMNSYGFVGNFLFDLVSVILHIVDVATDIFSAVDLVSGTEINHTMYGKENYENYTIHVCNDLIDYSHPIWASINLLFVWIPVVTFIPRLISHWKSSSSEIHVSKKVFALCAMIIFWPLIGIIL